MHEFEHRFMYLVRQCLQAPLRKIRNGAAHSIFGQQLKVDVSEGFPLLIGRKLYPAGVLGELAAMLRGPKHINDFKAWGCNYWDKWAEPDGSINVDYGNLWLDFNGVNQLEALRQSLLNNPTDRRMIVTSWKPDNLAELSLPCCHYSYQFYVREHSIDMVWIQRSVDVMIGLPSDIIFAAAWLTAIANEFNLRPGIITFQLGDCHVYEEHVVPALKYLNQANKKALECLNPVQARLNIPIGTRFEEFEPSWLNIVNYNPAAPISFLLKE